MPLTTVDQGLLSTNAQYTGFKNRLINGDMVISQRLGTSSVTPTTLYSQYTLDRWTFNGSQASKASVQQNAGSVTPPAGFTNYLGITSTSAYSVLSSDFFALNQYIEGFNISDLAFGTASASPVTLSFWVRSSLTGTFGGNIGNSAGNRNYVFSYTISAANTWEQKTVTIPGDTTGTWLTNNGIGFQLGFCIGSGSNFIDTAGVWYGSARYAPTGQTSIVGTNGATFYITGCQLERGSVATSFDVLPYGTELALCQRYFCKSFPQAVVPANNVAVDQAINGIGGRIQVADVLGFRGQQYFFPVTMRTTPSITMFNPLGTSGTGSYFTENNLTQNPASPGPYVTSEYNFGVWQYTGVTVGSTGTLVMVIFHYTASAEL